MTAKKETQSKTTTVLGEDMPHPKSVLTTYYLDGIPHVPHYYINAVYVSPGGKMCTVLELQARGATAIKQPLWTRDLRG